MADTKTHGGGPRIVTCEEQGPVEIPLDEVLDAGGRLRINAEIESGDYFAVSLRKGVLTLRARGHVGYIPLTPEIVVNVRPRVPVSNLSRVIQLSGQPPTVLTSLRAYDTSDEWNESLLDVYANAFVQHIEAIAGSGLWRDYARREEVSSFPRGRILLHKTVQSQHPRGIKHAASVAFFERTTDTPANRCLKYAIWFLAQQYIARKGKRTKEQRRLLRHLNAIYAIFDDVELDHQRNFMTDKQVNGSRPLPTLRAYYRDALNVAIAIAEQRTILIDSPTGAVRLPAIVMNMNYVFESYVRNSLSRYAARHGWAAAVLDGNDAGKQSLFDGQPQPEATPDIAVQAPDKTFPLVLEIKNVPIKQGELSDRSHLNQIITYAITHRTSTVVLVHPRASVHQTGGIRLLGHVDHVAVYQYRYDLGAADLEAEDDTFGAAVGALLPPALV